MGLLVLSLRLVRREILLRVTSLLSGRNSIQQPPRILEGSVLATSGHSGVLPGSHLQYKPVISPIHPDRERGALGPPDPGRRSPDQASKVKVIWLTMAMALGLMAAVAVSPLAS